MKIALCAPADIHALARAFGPSIDGVAPGLGSTATTPLIAELVRRGHEVTLFTLSHDLTAPQEHRWGPLRIFIGPARRQHMTRTFYKSEIAYLRQVIQDTRPAFVNAHWTYEFALGSLAASVPTLVTIHDLPWNVLRYFRDAHRTVRLMMAYSVAAQCRTYTAVSADAARHFRRYLRPDANIQVIPNFLDSKLFESSSQPPEPQRSVTFATVLQGWTRRKNPKPAILAFQRIREEFPDARLLMFGHGYEPGGEAQRWAEARQVAGGIAFRGPLPYEELLTALNREAGVLVHPSLDEAFSLTILEAMALGKPVIAGRSTPGVQEMLEESAGIEPDISDHEALAATMRRFLTMPGLATQEGEALRKRARQCFTAQQIIPQYEEAYRRFAAR